MQPMTRLSRKELIELIEATEAAGNDATELRNFLAQLPDEGRPRQPARQGGGRAVLEEEEAPLRDRLNREVGDLFDGGVTDELEARCIDMDRDYSTKELQAMCKEAGLSPNGHKKQLAAKLIAHNGAPTEKPREVRIVRDETAYDEEPGHPALPEGVHYPVQYKEIKAVIDGIGHVTYSYYPSVRVGHIEVVDIEPAYRRRGFGSKLVQFALDDIRRRGIVKVSASILSREGIQLLEAHGFSFVDNLMEVKL